MERRSAEANGHPALGGAMRPLPSCAARSRRVGRCAKRSSAVASRAKRPFGLGSRPTPLPPWIAAWRLPRARATSTAFAPGVAPAEACPNAARDVAPRAKEKNAAAARARGAGRASRTPRVDSAGGPRRPELSRRWHSHYRRRLRLRPCLRCPVRGAGGSRRTTDRGDRVRDPDAERGRERVRGRARRLAASATLRVCPRPWGGGGPPPSSPAAGRVISGRNRG